MKNNFKLSKAQSALKKLLALPASGFEMEVIEQTSSFVGLTEALRDAEESQRSTLNHDSAVVIVAEGSTAQESVRMMSRTAGTRGADMGTRLGNAIRHMSGIGAVRRAVAIVFDEAESMKGADLIKIMRTASFVASREDINLRLVFVIGKVPKYDFKRRGYFDADYPAMWSDAGLRQLYSPHARVWQFNEKSLSERKPVKAWVDADGLESAHAPMLREVKTA